MAWPRLLAVAACSAWRARRELRLRRREHGHPGIRGDGVTALIDGHNHVLTLPQDYDIETPVPLILYMHGWGGDASEGDAFASTARKKGIATAALEGGGPAGWRSWNAGGSSSSPGPRGATCKPGSTDYCSYYTENVQVR